MNNTFQWLFPFPQYIFIRVAYRIQILKEIFFENSGKLGYSFIKNYIIYMYLSFIHKTPIILGLSKIVTSNFTIHILTILLCSLQIKVIGK